MALFAVLTGCNSSEDIDDTSASVSARLALAVSQVSTPTTRQGGDVVQTSSVRDIELLRFIPFAAPVNGSSISVSDVPKSLSLSGGSAEHWYGKEKERFFLSQGFLLTPGTASFLIYGRAKPQGEAAENGALTATLPNDGAPSGISFNLHQIKATTDVPDDAKAIAAYLNRIAAAEATIDGVSYSWKNSTNSLLKVLYRNFIGQGEDFTSSKMAGSSANVSKMVEDLRFTLNNQNEHFIGDATGTAIRNAIVAEIDNHADFPDNYPSSLGLPDGAAVLMWTAENGFVPQVEASTMADILNIDSYCYPAELYYFTNSLIRTSNADVSSDYYSEYLLWSYMLSEHYNSGSSVTSNTHAVAIVDPLQYAVSCLQVKLKQAPATLLDSQGQEIAVTETAFPLTGIIVGGQHKVGFDFKPLDPTESEPNPERFIYDSQLKTNMASGTADYFYLSPDVVESDPVGTLVMQSNNDEEVKVVLEFQNNSGTEFYGANNGLVYPGTKFYMTGSVKPPADRTKDYESRIFTQDYTTTLSIRVNTLEKAYNVLPDLLSPSLEVGIQITNKWVQSTPSTVVL